VPNARQPADPDTRDRPDSGGTASSAAGSTSSSAGGSTAGLVADNTVAGLRDQLARVWGSLETLIGTFGEAEWACATACPGWTVADQVAHVVGTESMLAGHPAPPTGPASTPPHVRNDIGKVNEAWVDHYRNAGTGTLLADFRRVTAERIEQLGAMDDAALDRPSWTPVGQATYRRFLQVRVFDCWVHEQDIRLAVGRPGHLEGPAAEQSVDEVVRALGYLVGKRAAAPAGTRLRLTLTGPVHRTVDVVVAGRAQVVEPDGEPTATVLLPSDLLLRLACGRQPADAALDHGLIALSGDAGLARRVVEHLAYTI